MFWTDQFAPPRFEKDHTWSMWDFCLPALVVTNKPKWQPRMKKWFVHVCSDITSARKKPFESYFPRGRLPLQKTRSTLKQREGVRGGSSQQTSSPLFLGARLASRYGRFEVSASWRVPRRTWSKRNETRWFTKRGGWEMVAWMDLVFGGWLVALSRRCIGVLNDFLILTCLHRNPWGNDDSQFWLAHNFGDGLKVVQPPTRSGIVWYFFPIDVGSEYK